MNSLDTDRLQRSCQNNVCNSGVGFMQGLRHHKKTIVFEPQVVHG